MEEIVIDARMINDTGVGRYMKGLMQYLPLIDSERKYSFIVPSMDPISGLSFGNEVNWIVDRSPRYSIQELININKIISFRKPVLFHSMNYIMPPLIRCPTVVTIHDVIRPVMPKYFYTNSQFIHKFGINRFLQLSIIATGLFPFISWKHKNLLKYFSADFDSWVRANIDHKQEFKMHHFYQMAMLDVVTKNVTTITTVSEHSKRDICKILDVLEAKINVIYGAADSVFRPIENAAQFLPVHMHHIASCRYIMYVGLGRPHKNIHGLLQAFAELLRIPEFKPLRLVLVGDKSQYDSYVIDLVQNLSLMKYVHFTGYVSDELLALLYNLATVVVVPSFYEGFGLPALEAMACGTPVIASSASSLPEVIGNAGVLFDPFRVTELTKSMIMILSDNNLRNKLKILGLKRAEVFSWEHSAEQLKKLYDAVISSRSDLSRNGNQ